jgi:energy-converting hydrogenase Eha subunit B
MLIAFIFAANLRDPVGDFLAGNWTQFNLGYNRLLAFGIIFIVGSVVASITIQGFYKRTDLTADHPIADDAIGGLLGLAQGIVVLTMLVIIFNSYTLPPPHSGDVAQVRQAQDLIIHESNIAGADKDYLVPPFVRILSPLLPADLGSLFP